MLVYRSVLSILRKNMFFNKKSIITSAFGWQKTPPSPPTKCVQRRKKTGGGEGWRRSWGPRQLFSFTPVSPLHLQQKKKTTVEWSGPVVCQCRGSKVNLGLNCFFLLIWLFEDRGLLRCNDKTYINCKLGINRTSAEWMSCKVKAKSQTLDVVFRVVETSADYIYPPHHWKWNMSPKKSKGALIFKLTPQKQAMLRTQPHP